MWISVSDANAVENNGVFTLCCPLKKEPSVFYFINLERCVIFFGIVYPPDTA